MTQVGNINNLIEELRSDNIQLRINSVKNINQIAAALGKERSRNELVPFLQELMDDQDEIILTLIECLPQLVNDIGGLQQIFLLIPYIQDMLANSQSEIRTNALHQITLILQDVQNIDQCENNIMELIKNLFQDNYHGSKQSVSELIPQIIQKFSSQSQKQLWKIVQQLSEDSYPQTRKHVAQNLFKFIFLVPIIPLNEIHAIFESLIKNEEDFIRMHLVEFYIIYAEKYPKEPNVTKYFEILSTDSSWRVLYMISQKIQEITKNLGPIYTKQYFLPFYLKCLEQEQIEVIYEIIIKVKTIAVQKMYTFSLNIEKEDVINLLLPVLKNLSSDLNNNIRECFADQILCICQIVGKKATNESILPIFLALLKDTNSEVKIKLFEQLDKLSKVIGVEKLQQSIIPSFQDLAGDKNWRFRETTINFMPYFAKQIGPSFFNEKICLLISEWLVDRVQAIRETTVKVIAQIMDILGSSWAEQYIFNNLFDMPKSHQYQQRITFLLLIKKTVKKINPEYFAQKIYPILIQLYKDKVPNVRINISSCLLECFKYQDKKDSFKKMIVELSQDLDIDVSYSAFKSLELAL